MIAAGSTGSVPATAALLRTIAYMPNGAVVLPGIDLELDRDDLGGDGGGAPAARHAAAACQDGRDPRRRRGLDGSRKPHAAARVLADCGGVTASGKRRLRGAISCRSGALCSSKRDCAVLSVAVARSPAEEALGHRAGAARGD